MKASRFFVAIATIVTVGIVGFSEMTVVAATNDPVSMGKMEETTISGIDLDSLPDDYDGYFDTNAIRMSEDYSEDDERYLEVIDSLKRKLISRDSKIERLEKSNKLQWRVNSILSCLIIIGIIRDIWHRRHSRNEGTVPKNHSLK